MTADPGETTNVAARYPKVVAKLKQILQKESAGR